VSDAFADLDCSIEIRVGLKEAEQYAWQLIAVALQANKT
jgi:hypothetical protein